MQKVIRKAIKTIFHITEVVLIVVLLAMIASVFFDTLFRYLFNYSSIAMQELEWHLFAIIILFGVPYAFRLQAHVRVDFVYERLSLNTQNKIDIFGTLFFLFPFSILIISTSFSFVMDSYEILEISSDPGGLQYRWIVKAMIPASFVLLQIAAIEYIWNILSPENLDTTEDIVHHTGSWKESIK